MAISKINKQGCGLARKGHGNAVFVLIFCTYSAIFEFYLVKLRSNKLITASKHIDIHWHRI